VTNFSEKILKSSYMYLLRIISYHFENKRIDISIRCRIWYTYHICVS